MAHHKELTLRRATHASDPPTHTSHPQQGTNAARLQSRQSQSSSHSVSQQPLRLRAGGWATNGRLLCTHLRTRGAPTTRRAGADRARPSAGPPRSDARHPRLVRLGSTAGASAAAAIPHRTMHACARPVSRPPPGETPAPYQGPRIRAETSATSAERVVCFTANVHSSSSRATADAPLIYVPSLFAVDPRTRRRFPFGHPFAADPRTRSPQCRVMRTPLRTTRTTNSTMRTI